ncbi:hypothetical protein BH23PLA1_BH23PLA1_06190 [soil metagenome]
MPIGALVRRVVLGLGLTLACEALAPTAQTTVHAAQAEAPIVFSREPAFKIPFSVEPADRERIAEVHLYYSADRGLSWERAGSTSPDQIAFPFRASRDGEYWFAVRTRDARGRYFPSGEEEVSPGLKVIVDTTAPSLVVEVLPRRGSAVAIRWEAQDENLDLSTLAVEYQAQGARADAWRRVQINPSLVGLAQWDAMTAGPLAVRVSVADRAGNVRRVDRVLPDGVASRPPLQNVGPGATTPPPPITPINMAQRRPSPDPELGDPFADLGSPSQGGFATPGRDRDHDHDHDPFPGGPPAPAPVSPNRNPAASQPLPRSAPEGPLASTGPGGVPALLVGAPRVPLQYAIEEADPSVVAVVELWVSLDGGASWKLLGNDPDRRSPFPVDLGVDGEYGLRIVVKTASGLGDAPPRPGDPPEMIVTVDTTPPSVTLDPPTVSAAGGGAGGVVSITWRAADPHLAERPVVLSYRPDRPGAVWQQFTDPIPNTGRYDWELPPNLPPNFHVRIDVFDAVGNRNYDETPSPVVIDTARPKGRIIGLDPNARVNYANPRR